MHRASYNQRRSKHTKSHPLDCGCCDFIDRRRDLEAIASLGLNQYLLSRG